LQSAYNRDVALRIKRRNEILFDFNKILLNKKIKELNFPNVLHYVDFTSFFQTYAVDKNLSLRINFYI